MQWYVYLMAIAATVFLGHMAVELVGRPIRTLLHLRRKALERMLFFEHMPLPRPRELAISSQAIHEYNLAIRNAREARCTFRDLGSRLLALGENEPTIRVLINLFGLNFVLAGRELVNLSEAYAAAEIDSATARHRIQKTLHTTSVALMASRRLSSNDLTKIRLEPMYLRNAGLPRNRGRRPLGRPPVVSGHAGRSHHQFRQTVLERTAFTA